MAAVLCDIAFDEEAIVDTPAEPADLLSANPLGKIPTLILRDGTSLYDSRVICEYLDRISGNALVPLTDAEWIASKRMEATADGVIDAAILTIYEVRFRPEDRRHEPWVDKQWRKALRGLKVLEDGIGDVPDAPTIGHLSAAALLAWLSLRFEGRWEAEHPQLHAWAGAFFESHTRLQKVKPRL